MGIPLGDVFPGKREQMDKEKSVQYMTQENLLKSEET